MHLQVILLQVVRYQQDYRYAFQGQEKDPETGMEAFELRLWDGRLGRWLTVDPYHEFHSPYVGMGNNPVNLTDPDGGCTKCPKNANVGDSYNHSDYGDLAYSVDGAGNGFWSTADGTTILNDVEVGPGAKISGIDPILALGIDLKSGSFIKNIDKMADLKNFEIKNFTIGNNYETQKLGPKSIINNGKLYEEGTEETLKNLKYLKNGVKIVKFGVPVVGLAYSGYEWTRGDISGELLALDGVMTGVGFTGFGAPISAVYFIGIRGRAMGMDREIVQKFKQNEYNNPQTPYNVRVQDNVKVNVIKIH